MHRAPAFSVLVALVAFAVLMVVAMARAGWVFEYPLDDVYIHLAMAEQIAQGGYGVNRGELASAASSPLYPFLLLPFPGSEAQRYLPLFWNLVGLIACAWLWGRILVRAGLFEGASRPVGWAAALLGPIVINSFGLAFMGMEHALHAAASLAIVLGLLRLVQGERLTAPLLLGLVLTTAFRLEGLALGLLAGLVVWRVRGGRAAVLCMALTLLPALIFAGGLVAMGLDPMPESVQAKLTSNATFKADHLQLLIAAFLVNIGIPAGTVLLGGALVVLLSIVTLPALREKGPRSFALAVFLAVIAHLVFGRIGWMDRYEGYIWGTLAAGIMVLASWHGGRVLPALMLALISFGALYAYGSHWTDKFTWSIRAIHLQQAQSARFAQDFVQAPVAVNDLGRVAWANPDYVLDLWGLASADARYWRIENPVEYWAGPLAQARDVELAMIYKSWLPRAAGPGWVKLGELHIAPPIGALGVGRVSYFATAPRYVPAIEQALADWVPTLPKGASWRPAGGR